MKFVLQTFLIWRLLLFFPILLGSLVLPYRSGYIFSGINSFFLHPWANFDGIHYLTIATSGYTTEANFFPIFPILIKLFSLVFGSFNAGFLIANLSFLLALIFLYKLVLLDFSERVAKRVIIFLLIFPTSFYFGSVYTEGLFLLLIVCSFYFARKNNWVLSSILGMFSSATRLTGVLMLPALFYQYAKKSGLRLSPKLISLFLVPLGLIGYSLFNFYKWGDAFQFIKAHGSLSNNRTVDGIVLFPQTIFRYIKILTDLTVGQYEWWIALLELSVFFFGALLLYIAWKQKIRTEYLIFSFFSFLIPVLSGTFSALPRYVLVLFPVFMALALIKSKLIRFSYIILSPILLFILLMFFSRGYFVA